MIEELGKLLDDFPGSTNQTRCFAHILNLVVKSILSQFDVPKAKAGTILNVAEKALQELEEDLEEVVDEYGSASIEDEIDNLEGWIDEREEMTEEEKDELDESVRPMRTMLTKVVTYEINGYRADLKSIASQTLICYQEFVYHNSSEMVFNSR
jgi:hypothetical protein